MQRARSSGLRGRGIPCQAIRWAAALEHKCHARVAITQHALPPPIPRATSDTVARVPPPPLFSIEALYVIGVLRPKVSDFDQLE
jgi:hypothetical protein